MGNKEKTALREYLISTRDFWCQYRTQKENAACVATTVYLGGLFALDSYIFLNRGSGLSGLLLIDAFGLLILISGYLTWGFVNQQNKDRIFASKLTSACNDVLTQLFDNKLSKGELVKHEFWEQGLKWSFPYILYLSFEEHRNDYSPEKFSWSTDSLFVIMAVWTFATLILLMFLSIQLFH